MRLWILRPIDEGVEPWYPWMEHRAFGFVVRAKDESAARVLAATHAWTKGRERGCRRSSRPVRSCRRTNPKGSS
jgi:hypothetical protein